MLAEESVLEEKNPRKYKATIAWYVAGAIAFFYIMVRGQGDASIQNHASMLQYAENVGVFGFAFSFVYVLLIPAPIVLAMFFFRSYRNIASAFKVFRVFCMILLVFVVFSSASEIYNKNVSKVLESTATHATKPFDVTQSPAPLVTKPTASAALSTPATEGSEYTTEDLLIFSISCASLTRSIDGDAKSAAIYGKTIAKMSQLGLSQEEGDGLIKRTVALTREQTEKHKSDANFIRDLRDDVCGSAKDLIPDIQY